MQKDGSIGKCRSHAAYKFDHFRVAYENGGINYDVPGFRREAAIVILTFGSEASNRNYLHIPGPGPLHTAFVYGLPEDIIAVKAYVADLRKCLGVGGVIAVIDAVRSAVDPMQVLSAPDMIFIVIVAAPIGLRPKPGKKPPKKGAAGGEQ